MDEARNPFDRQLLDAATTSGVLVGRAREGAAIEALIDQLAAGAPVAPLVFSGRSGVGTSALLAAVGPRADLRDWYCGSASVRADVPLRDAIGTACARSLRSFAARRPGAAGLRTASDAVAGFAPSAIDELPSAVSANALAVTRGDLARDLRRLLAGLGDSFRDLVGRGLIVMLDDLHHAEPHDAVVLLRSFADAMHDGQPVGLVASGTPTVRWFAESAGVAHALLDVLPLTAADVDEFVTDRLGAVGVGITPDALALIARATAGYPALVQLYAQAAWNLATGDTIEMADVTSGAGSVRAHLAAAVLEPAFAVSAASRRYVRAVAEADDPADSDEVARRLGDTTRFGAGSSQLGVLRDELIRRGVLSTTDGVHLSFSHPASRSFVLSWQ